MKPKEHFSLDFHVHTSYSYDCPVPPRVVIEIARRKGLDGIAVTDHDTVDGALATMDANRHSDFLVIPGIEVKSDFGDIIGLYVQRQIRSRRFSDVIQEIHEQGGIVYVPHPIRTFGADRMQQIHAGHPQIDLWELYNGRYDRVEFRLAGEAFTALGITGALCGSDAHFPWDIGAFRTVLPGLPRDAQQLLALSRMAELRAKPRSELAVKAGIHLGAATKSFKRGDYGKVALLLTKLPWSTVKRMGRGFMGIS